MSDDTNNNDNTPVESTEIAHIPEVSANPEDDVIAQIDEFLTGYEGTPLEDFTKNIGETLKAKYGPDSVSDAFQTSRLGTPVEEIVGAFSDTLKAKYGPGSMSEKYDFSVDHDDIFDPIDGALADMDQVQPSKFDQFMESDNLGYYLAVGALTAEVGWTLYQIAKIAKRLRN